MTEHDQTGDEFLERASQIQTSEERKPPAKTYLRSLRSEKSRRSTLNRLRTVAALLLGEDPTELDNEYVLGLNWERLTYEDVEVLRTVLVETGYSDSSINAMLSAIRGVMKKAFASGLISAEVYQRILLVESVSFETLPAGRDVPPGEILALVTACKGDQSPIGIRDAAILGLLCTCGMRRAELVGLNLEDYDAESGELKVLMGKGRKQRKAFVEGGAARALKDWLAIRGSELGPLFYRFRKGGKMEIGRLSEQSVYNTCKKRAKEAGIPTFSPHDLRRTVVGALLNSGTDLATVARIVGHSQVTTTQRYDRRPDAASQEAVRRLHFPY